MPSDWKNVRVFISSTFRDMQAERDHLVRFVFPKLRQELLLRRIHLTDVDLRWGVTSEQDALSVCHEVVDECRPRFLCVLGGRYGWVPPGKTHSITADEVHYGVLDRDLKNHGFAYFYFRDPAVTAAMVEVAPGEFSELDGSGGAVALAELKTAIIEAGLQPFIYRAHWDDESRRLFGLKELGARVYADLKQSIEQEFGPATWEKPDEFTEENAAMEAFIEERAHRFVLGSRQPIWNDLRRHAESTGGNGYLCLTGVAGSGKSALLGKFCQYYREAHPQDLVIPHFVGASPGSTDVRRTLRRLCHELATGATLTVEIPEDPDKLRMAFAEILQQASAKKRVVILLDAINQFDSTTQFARWPWLPEELPGTARIILSTLSGPALDSMRQRRQPPQPVELQPLDVSDREAIIRGFLHRYRKSMTDDQRAALLAKADAGSPLYLLVALEELRTLGTYEEISDRIAQLPPDTRALFIWILKRLEDDDGFRDASGLKIGQELVSRFVSLLGVSRHGLSQQELVELLSPGDPQGNVAALVQLLRPYLLRRGELLDFYHNQFRIAVERTWIKTDSQRQSTHLALANYFDSQPLYSPKPTKEDAPNVRSPNFRKLGELAFHFSQAEDDRIIKLFDSPDWMNARIKGSGNHYLDYIADLTLAWNKHAHARVADRPELLGLCFRLALIRTSLNSIVRNAEPSLVAPAVATGLWTFERGMNFLETMQHPDQKARTLLALLKMRKLDSTQRGRIQRLLLATVPRLDAGPQTDRGISSHDVLCRLAPFLDPELASEAWNCVKMDWPRHNGLYNAKFIETFAPFLKDECLAEALNLSLKLPGRTYGELRSAICALAPHLNDLLPHALNLVSELKEPWDRGDCLVALAPYLPDALRTRARTMAQELPDDSTSTELDWFFHIPGKQSVMRALDGLQEKQEMPLTTQAKLSRLETYLTLRRALRIPDERARLTSLLELVPKIDKGSLEKAIKQTLNILHHLGTGNWEFKRALIQLAPHLTSQTFAEAFSLALEIDSTQNEAIEALMSRASQGLDSQAITNCLELIQKVSRDWTRAEVLAGLACHCNEDQFDFLLAECGRLDGPWQVDLIEAMAPLLNGRRLQQLFSLAMNIPPPRLMDITNYRSRAIEALAPYLDKSILEDHFRSATRIIDQEQELWALVTAFPNLQGELLLKALDRYAALAGFIERFEPALEKLRKCAAKSDIASNSLKKTKIQPPEIRGQDLETSGHPNHFEASFIKIVLDTITKMPPFPRGVALVVLAPILGQTGFKRALDAVRELQCEQVLEVFLEAAVSNLGAEHFMAFCETVSALTSLESKTSLFMARVQEMQSEPQQLAVNNGLKSARELKDGQKCLKVKAIGVFAPLHVDRTFGTQALAEGLEEVFEDLWRSEAGLIRALFASADAILKEQVCLSVLSKNLERGLREPTLWSRFIDRLAVELDEEVRQRLFNRLLCLALELEEPASRRKKNTRLQLVMPLISHLHEADRQRAVNWILKLAHSLDEADWTTAILACGNYARGEEMKHIWELARAPSRNPGSALRTQIQLAPKLDNDDLESLFHSILSLTDETEQANAISSLAPLLKGRLLQEAFGHASQMKLDHIQVQIRLALKMGEAELLSVVRRVWTVANETDRARAIREMAPLLRGSLFDEIFSHTLRMKSAPERDRTIFQLVVEYEREINAENPGEIRRLSSTDASRLEWNAGRETISRIAMELLDAIRRREGIEKDTSGWGDWRSSLARGRSNAGIHKERVHLLCEIGPLLSEATADRVFEAIIISETDPMTPYELKLPLFVSLAGQISRPMVAKAFATALQYSKLAMEVGERARVMEALAPRLGGADLARAIDIVVHFPEQDLRAASLHFLAAQVRRTGNDRLFVGAVASALLSGRAPTNDCLALLSDEPELDRYVKEGISEALLRLSGNERKAVLCHFSDCLCHYLDAEMMRTMSKHILEICGFWTWA